MNDEAPVEEKRRRPARFKVRAQLDSAGGKKNGTVLIDRETGIITVRPERSRTAYQARLDNIADFIVKTALMAGTAARFSPKKARRRL